VFETNRLNVV